MFQKTLYAGWDDIDLNGHMVNSAYLKKAVDVRMMFFAENGFPVEEFVRRHFGPVVQKEEIEYFKEYRLLEPILVGLSLAGLSEDGSRFMVCNEFRKQDGRLAARVTSLTGWLDLSTRKLIAPPADLLAVFRATPQTPDFQVLPSSLKS